MDFEALPRFLSPGEIYVSSDKAEIIETYLGSCVGIALYDPQLSMGGMAHIILPQGNKDKESAIPGRYASSGIPCLIRKMLKEGAVKERLEAKIAGGASIVNDTDLKIGQRNIAKVREILAEQGIPIINEDVGGNFGRVFRLYIKNGRTETRIIGQKLQEKASTLPRAAFKEVTLKALLQRIEQLRPMSKTIDRVLKIIEANPFTVEEIKKEIYKDQVLTANILKICNSPYYGFSQRITNLSQGIVLLGINTIKRIVISLSFKDILTSDVNSYFLKQGEFFEHALGCALMAEMIARQKQYPEPEAVFTAGLLHDIGKLVLDQVASSRFYLTMRKVFQEKISFLEAEKEILGYTHSQVGEMVGRQWHLPKLLVEVIAYHHSPEKAQEFRAAVAIVHIADVICRMAGIGCGAVGLTNPVNPYALRILNLNAQEIDNLIEKLPEVVNEIKVFEQF